MRIRTLSGWGRTPRHKTVLRAPRTLDALAGCLETTDGVIARGAGRAYGDSAVGAGQTISMRHFNRMLGFARETGVLDAEAGVVLGDIVRTFLPRGWFPAVTPGTQFVTLGGMIAADVHGKNHHQDGSIGSFIDWIDLMGPDGRVTRVMPEDDMFHATLGGMGLTGVIIRAAMRMRAVETGWIRTKTVSADNLETLLAAMKTHAGMPYSVAWVDCLARGSALGRGLLMLGEHASRDALTWAERDMPWGRSRRRKTVPFELPISPLTPLSVRAFNEVYWRAERRAGVRLQDWESYFYPLDAITNWPRIYGRRGFYQFQCVVPAAAALEALLDRVARSGQGVFLGVLKQFGEERPAGISFPRPGYTLALDIPVASGAETLMRQLEETAIAHDGRFYLAKDARMGAGMLRRSDPRVEGFARWRRQQGLDVFDSKQSERLGI